MTLEDFFTSTELKDGFTTFTRVNELIIVMQKEKENDAKNISESSRQWAAVANTIANTEVKECLDFFIKLDGLSFINKWLNDALTFVDDSGNSVSEELIISLLRAIERLQVDHDRSVSSGIGKTVEGLVVHSNSVVQEKAKSLCDKWTVIPDVDKKTEAVGDENKENKSNEVEKEKEKVEEEPRDEKMLQGETDKDKEEEIPTTTTTTTTQETVTESTTTNHESTEVMEPVESDKSKSESTALVVVSGSKSDDNKENVEDEKEKEKEKEKQEIDSSSPLEEKSLVENVLESVTKTEVKEDASEKDEEMVDATQNGDSSEEGESPKRNSNSGSDEDDVKKEEEEKNDSRISKRSTKSQDVDLISKRASDMDLDYGIVDPLELARQVANEVEREVDSSCSSDSASEIEQKEKEKEKDKEKEGKEEVSSSAVVETEKQPQVSEQPNPEKGFSGFDLNQEVSSDETDFPISNSTPISVVSASRAAAADGPPVAPLQFEGSLGWKGSAATSAFRRIPEVEKTFSSPSKHLDFDLNVADDDKDKEKDKNPIEDYLSRDKMPIQSERLQLDLNSLGDGDFGNNINLDWKRETRQNGPQSPSVSSSSRNIDLNLNDHSTTSFENPFLGKLFNNNNNNNKRDESVISIFGTQVEVKRKDSISIPPLNGRILNIDPTVDFTLGRPGSSSSSSIPYSNLPGYSHGHGHGHNGFPMGPTAMSFTTTPMYGGPPPGGPIPYMVDSRGSPIVPQLMGGPSSSIPPPQPFLFNMAATNGAGPSRHHLDLNSGFETNGGGLRQFFGQSQSQMRPVEEQYLRMNNQASSSSSSAIGGKRQEPDSGWELFPINYKHHQQPPPPWQ